MARMPAGRTGSAAPSQPQGPGGAAANLMVANQVAGQQQQLGIIVNQLHAVKQKQAETEQATMTAISELRGYCQYQFSITHKTVGRLLVQAPTRRVPGGRPAGTAVANSTAARATAPNNPGLSKCPRSLHDLWKEWTDGIDRWQHAC